MHFIIYSPIHNNIKNSTRDTRQTSTKDLIQDGFEILKESGIFLLVVNPSKTFVAFVTDSVAFHIDDVPKELFQAVELYRALKEF